jgi:hypothetical protein
MTPSSFLKDLRKHMQIYPSKKKSISHIVQGHLGSSLNGVHQYRTMLKSKHIVTKLGIIDVRERRYSESTQANGFN